MKCPHCGKEFKDEGRRKGGSRRWKGTRKAERSAVMKAVRAAGKVKSNVVFSDSPEAARSQGEKGNESR